jgi:para-aminobenzoate synthetase component 1
VNRPIVPLTEIFKTSLTPIEVFEAIHDEPFSFFLDSAAGRERLGKYSFLGYDPFLIMKVTGKEIEISQAGSTSHVQSDPFVLLKNLLFSYPLASQPEMPPFTGGVVGYFGYDLGRLIEVIPSVATDDVAIPDAHLAFYDTVVIVDHLADKVYISSTGFPEEKETLRKERAISKIKEWKKKLSPVNRGKSEPPHFSDSNSSPQLTSNFTRDQYMKAISAAKEYIAAGDIYQVNLSQRFVTEAHILPFPLYKRLRTINPAPFAGYLNLDGVNVLSSSPERFLRISGKKVETRPIKGTRPRGKNAAEDKRMRKELLESKKDQAELVMIVDLERNDLGRVCEYGSVSVPELTTLEQYPTVFHTVSTVTGTLREECDHIDCLRACFPGGSITGAPKIRSMEIIEELEPTRRKIYTGSLGYLGFNGETDLNIIIRTMVVTDGKVYFQAGGGIVADSDPEKEYEETLHKVSALFSALNQKP